MARRQGDPSSRAPTFPCAVPKKSRSLVHARSSMPDIGDTIGGKYVVDGILGRGGMSVVYRATHRELEHEVAVKVLCDAASSQPEYVARLKQEARIASRLRSEHVVRVHDIGELAPGRNPYLVMECLCGHDLAAMLARRGTFSVPVAVECILQLAEALAEAHAHGIVHRDLKPANVFLLDNVVGRPRIKVLDFGISRTLRACDARGLTDPGIALGTPSYMAPEQMEASPRVDARSDIWALGAILYELLVGQPPFRGTTLPQIFVNILRSKPPRPSDARSDVPAALDAVVKRCLSVDPAGRFGSAAELARALSSFARTCANDSPSRSSVAPGNEGPREITLPSVAIAASPSPFHVASAYPVRTAIAGTFVAALLLGGLLTAFGMTALRARDDVRENAPENAHETTSREGPPGAHASEISTVPLRAALPAPAARRTEPSDVAAASPLAPPEAAARADETVSSVGASEAREVETPRVR